jgi:RES domain-containing protein
MIVFRLVAEPNITLNGDGSRLYPGRWNHKGIPCLYTSENSSVATLEVLVNAGDWRIFNARKYKLLHIHVPDKKIIRIRDAELPGDWNTPSISNSTRTFGSDILMNQRILGFSVPSVVAPLERNIILNTSHLQFRRWITVKKVSPFHFDERLLKK